MAAGGGLRRPALSAGRRRPARPSAGRAVRGDVGLHHDRRHDPRRRRGRRSQHADVEAVHPVAGRHGHHRARPRRAPPAPRRRAPAARIRDAGARGRPARRPHPLDGATAMAPLRRPVRRDGRHPDAFRRRRHRPSHGPLRGRLDDLRRDADRRLHAGQPLAGRVCGRLAMGGDRVHGGCRCELRAQLPGHRAAAGAPGVSRRGAAAVPGAARPRLRRPHRAALGRGRRGRRGRPSSRHVPGRVDHDDDGLRQRRLRRPGRRSR